MENREVHVHVHLHLDALHINVSHTVTADAAVTALFHSIKEDIAAMSKTQADVQAALDDLSTTVTTALADISTEVTSLEAQIAALQGQSNPDLSPLLDSVAAIKAKIVAADPGAPAAPATA